MASFTIRQVRLIKKNDLARECRQKRKLEQLREMSVMVTVQGYGYGVGSSMFLPNSRNAQRG